MGRLNILSLVNMTSEIPKIKAVEATSCLKARRRESYLGAIVFFGGPNLVEAFLVLCSAFQISGCSWLQAGARTILLSNLDRNL